MIRKIVSGGQTGADRAAFDFALSNGIEIGGYVPRGRVAEDGVIPARYEGLTETGSTDYAERTKLNVLNSDATLVFTVGEPAGGTKLTIDLAGEAKRPALLVDLMEETVEDRENAISWLDAVGPVVLNIAGPRLSEQPGIYEKVFRFLTALKRGEA